MVIGVIILLELDWEESETSQCIWRWKLPGDLLKLISIVKGRCIGVRVLKLLA